VTVSITDVNELARPEELNAVVADETAELTVAPALETADWASVIADEIKSAML
jgi:hypothetical protein